MPYPNEHSARLHEPGKFKDKPDWSKAGKFRRTKGGNAVLPGAGMTKVPATIGIIWGQLKTQKGRESTAQALRFPIKDWTEAQARKWLKDNKVKYIKFEPAEPAKEESKEPENLIFDPKCFDAHLGEWMIEPEWLSNAIRLIRAGVMKPMHAVEAEEREFYHVVEDGIAVINLMGAMGKSFGKYTKASTIFARQGIRAAVRDKSVNGILLHIDSPGGAAAGTNELARQVKLANKEKPVFAHIDDLGASAAYWVASQAQKIISNPTGQIGSIGTVAVVDDTSGKYEMQGIRVHVISTGDYKGSFIDGAPVSEKQLDYLQKRVDDLNAIFLNAISKGRDMPIAQVREVADGRVHIASEAKKLGLIDSIQFLEDSIAELSKLANGGKSSSESKGRARSAGAAARSRMKNLEYSLDLKPK